MTGPGKYGQPDLWLLVDGFDLSAAKVTGVTFKHEAGMEQSDGIGDAWEEFTPNGISKAEFTQEGAFFDTSDENSHEALKDGLSADPNGTARVVCLGFAGQEIGKPFVGLQGAYQQTYEVVGSNEKLTRANATYAVSGQIDHGVILHDLSIETADADTEADSVDHTTEEAVSATPITSNSQANPTIVTCPVPHGLTTGDTVLIAGVVGSSPTINGERTVTVLSTTTFSVPVDTSAGTGGTGGTFLRAKTNAGGVGYLQVKAITLAGFTSATVTLRDSSDDITFGDLVAFTAVTARGAQRVTVAGAVERYTAQEVAFNGSGTTGLTPSIEYFAGLARN